MDKNQEKAYTTVYTVARYLFLALFVGSVIDALLVCIFNVSLVTFSYRSWICLYEGMLYYASMPEMIAAFAIVGILMAAPYLVVFILSKKKLGWFMAGLVLYVFDFLGMFSFLMTVIGYGSAIRGELAHAIISTLIGLCILVFICVAYVLARRLPCFAKVGGFAAYDNAFSRIRILSIHGAADMHGASSVCYAINGRPMGELHAGELKIITIDGGYQRITVTTADTVGGEIMIPAGFDNPNIAVGRDIVDGVYKIIIYRI